MKNASHMAYQAMQAAGDLVTARLALIHLPNLAYYVSGCRRHRGA